MQFKKGDMVKCVAVDVSTDADRKKYEELINGLPVFPLKIGGIYRVEKSSQSSGYDWVDVVGEGVSVVGTYAQQFILFKPHNFMKKLTTSMKRILSKPLQTQYKAGIIDESLGLTELGRTELLNILAQEKEEGLTAIAKDILKEANDEE